MLGASEFVKYNPGQHERDEWLDTADKWAAPEEG